MPWSLRRGLARRAVAQTQIPGRLTSEANFVEDASPTSHEGLAFAVLATHLDMLVGFPC